MKTAVSIPDGVCRIAEKFAKQHRMSRSELFAKAVEEYVCSHSKDGLVAAINRVCDRVETKLDQGTKALRDASLPGDEW